VTREESVAELKMESHKIVLTGPSRIRIRDKKYRLVLELTVNGGTVFVVKEEKSQ
jgi:mRNA-degrading endonuclease RelE of RelBE toxin-antitoxin system